jgi:alpha-L-fucosidase
LLLLQSIRFTEQVQIRSLLLAVLITTACTGAQAEPPVPLPPLPSERQLRWHEMEFYGFIHFTVNTFTDKEWGYGDEDENVFNPTEFDADQIATTAKLAGMKGLILTAKHHDGFCLWPSQFTKHSVKSSSWKDGKGDVVKELSEASRRAGLKFGVYLSPWDRNHKDYGRPEYLTYYRNQLRELLTQYGEVFTVWFDGANGGDGFYGGSREKRQIDNRTYYDWPTTWELVRKLMPMAVMFSDAGPDVRWVGNERGIAGDPCWATLNTAGRYPGSDSKGLNSGERPGNAWIPAECDVSIRPGWFYHAAEDSRVKTGEQLLQIYYQSVGRGACLNLNLPPDRRGRINEKDVQSLKAFRGILDATFAHNLIKEAKVTANSTRHSAGNFGVDKVSDNKLDTYWASEDGETTPELVIDFGRSTKFSVIRLREYLPLGQRIEAFEVATWSDGKWITLSSGTSIGNCRLIRQKPVESSKVRIRITHSSGCAALSEVGIFSEPG